MTRVRNWLKGERGFSTAAVFIIALPLLVGVFGLAFDSVRLVYIKSYLQGRADLATQSAVNTSYTNPANRLIYLGRPSDGGTGQSSINVADSFYAQNTASKRGTGGFLSSTGTYGQPTTALFGAPLTPAQLCLPPATSGTKYGVTMTVQENVPTTFLKILGISSMPVSIESTALVRGRNC